MTPNNVGEGRSGVGVGSEAEVFRIKGDRGIDVIDHVADIDDFFSHVVTSCWLVNSFIIRESTSGLLVDAPRQIL